MDEEQNGKNFMHFCGFVVLALVFVVGGLAAAWVLRALEIAGDESYFLVFMGVVAALVTLVEAFNIPKIKIVTRGDPASSEDRR